MYRELIRVPLQQAMVLLWLLGLVRLVSGLGAAPPSAQWAISATVAAVILVLMGARLRIMSAIPVSVALGLAGIVAAAALLGARINGGIDVLTALYGLLLWAVTIHTLSSDRADRTIRLLGLAGGYGPQGGRHLTERYIYWSSLGLVGLAVLPDLLHGITRIGIPAVAWPIVVIGLVFLLLSGRRYGHVLNTYLATALAVLGLFSAVIAFMPADAGGDRAVLPLTTLDVGLVLICGAMLAAAGAVLLDRHTSRNGDSQGNSLHVKPLNHAAATLSLLAVLQLLVLAPGIGYTPAWPAVIILATAAAVVLLVNRSLRIPSLSAIAAIAATAAAVWLYAALVYGRPPLGLWPGGPAQGDEWLTLAVLTFCLALAGHQWFERFQWRNDFGIPFTGVAFGVFAWTLAGTLFLYPAGSPYLTWIFALLVAALFPLLRPLPFGSEIRGGAAGVLLTLLVAGMLGPENRAAIGGTVAMAWAFMLWGAGNLVLPRINALFPAWPVSPASWPWLGLVVLGMGLAHAYRPHEVPWGLSLVLALYLFLMLRQCAWSGCSWSAVATLSLGGVLLSADRHRTGLEAGAVDAVGMAAFETLLWANALFLLAALWRRHGEPIGRRMAWRDPALETPFWVAALSLCGLWLAGLLAWDGTLVLGAPPPGAEPMLTALLGGILTLTLLHAVAQRPIPLATHLLIAALLLTAVAAWGATRPFQLTLALVLFSALLATVWLRPSVLPAWLARPSSTVLPPWLAFTAIAGVASLPATPGAPLVEQLATLGVAGLVAALAGRQTGSRLWLYGAAGCTIILLHGVWLLWIPWPEAYRLFPLYALQFAILTGVVRWAYLRRKGSDISRGGQPTGPAAVADVVHHLVMISVVLTVVEWGVHVTTAVAAEGTLSVRGAWWGHAGAIAAPLVLAVLGIVESRRSGREGWIYLAAGLVSIAAVYCRLLWVGLAPVGVWDTAAVIAAAYALFVAQALSGSRPLLNLTVWVPLAALVTVPLQLNSMQAALSLFTIAALYLLTRRSTGMATPGYLALLSVNAGIYLWVPDWSTRFGLLQVYVVPAALSVLLLLQMHRKELKREVLNGARLAALTTLYAAATLDVFLQESLWVLLLVLVLSLAGTALGIVTRTRAFLYAGVVFLVLNVLGQLVQLYPEQRLERALMLMALGTAITATMIWFNLKREAILQRIGIVRADLMAWD